MKKLNKKGFTLVELLAVIVILALLMIVATSVIGNVQENARSSAMNTEAKKLISQAQKDYQLWLIEQDGPIAYAYQNGDPVDGTAEGTVNIEFKDDIYQMYAVMKNGEIEKYCITDGTGAKQQDGDYQSGAKCVTDKENSNFGKIEE